MHIVTLKGVTFLTALSRSALNHALMTNHAISSITTLTMVSALLLMPKTDLAPKVSVTVITISSMNSLLTTEKEALLEMDLVNKDEEVTQPCSLMNGSRADQKMSLSVTRIQ
jgi:hypothetical protein